MWEPRGFQDFRNKLPPSQLRWVHNRRGGGGTYCIYTLIWDLIDDLLWRGGVLFSHGAPYIKILPFGAGWPFRSLLICIAAINKFDESSIDRYCGHQLIRESMYRSTAVATIVIRFHSHLSIATVTAQHVAVQSRIRLLCGQ